MQLVSFAANAGHEIERFGSRFVLSPLTNPDGTARATCFHVPAGGLVGEHDAVGGQLFCVVQGVGWVSGADGRRWRIEPFQAAYWQSGERHGAGSDEGMVVVVLEGDGFRPFALDVVDR